MTKVRGHKLDGRRPTKRPLAAGDKQAMVEYYEAGLKTGRTSDDLLFELEARYGRSTRQVSRYVGAARSARQTAQKTQSPVDAGLQGQTKQDCDLTGDVAKAADLPPRELRMLIKKWQLELETHSPIQLLSARVDRADEDAKARFYTNEDVETLYVEAQRPHPLQGRPFMQVQDDPAFELLRQRFPDSGAWVAFHAWCEQRIPYDNAFYEVLKRAESAAAYATDTFIAGANRMDVRGFDWIDGHGFPGYAKRCRIERLFAVFGVCDLLACAIARRPSSSYWGQLVNDLKGLRLNVNVELSTAIGTTPKGGWMSGITDILAESPDLPLELTATFLDELAELRLRQDTLIEALKELEGGI